MIAIVSAQDYVEVEDILAAAREKGEEPFLILLDGITDPHNLGAILRTAECAGAHGVIVPKRRSVGLTATVGKTSAGAIAYLPVRRFSNHPQGNLPNTYHSRFLAALFYTLSQVL